MKVKVDAVNFGNYGYDSIVVKIDKQVTEICFETGTVKEELVGKSIELECVDGVYSIKE